MLDRGDHVLTDPESRDRVVIAECRFGDAPIRTRAVKGFFQPHLTQRKSLVARKMGGDSVRFAYFSHKANCILLALLEKPSSSARRSVVSWI